MFPPIYFSAAISFLSAGSLTLNYLPYKNSYEELESHEGKEQQTIDDLFSQGERLYREEQYQEAIYAFQEALLIQHQLDGRTGLGGILNAIGVNYYQLGQYSQAIEFYQKAREVFVKIGDREREVMVLNNLGVIHEIRGQYSEALESYKQALVVYEQINNYLDQGNVLSNIGFIYYKTGQYPEALEYYRQALTLRQKVADRRGEGLSFYDLGLVYLQLGQYTEALKLLQQALIPLEEVEDIEARGFVLLTIGDCYLQQEEYATAVEFYQKTIQLFRDVSIPLYEGQALGSLGEVYRLLHQYSQSLDSLEQSLEIAQRIGDRSSESRTLDSLGRVNKEIGEHFRAFDLYQQSLTISTKIGDLNTERITLSNIGDLFVQQNQPELAIIFYKRSINITEAIRRDIQGLPVEQQQSYTNTVADTYRKLADLLLQQDRVLEAQQVLDLLKVQEIQDYLRRGVRGNEQTAAGIYLLPAEERVFVQFDQLLQQGRRLAELDALPSETLTPEQQAEQAKLRTLQIQVKASFNGFLDLPDVQTALQDLRVRVPQALNLDALDAIRQNLVRSRPDAVLLYPFVLDDRLELVLMSPHLPPIHQTVPVTRVELNQAIVDFLTVLQDPQADPKPAAAKLYQWLGKPIEPFLQESGAKVILYAPDQRLRYIPLAALYDGQQWFVEKYQINQLTAANLTSLDTPPRSQPRILAGAFAAGRYMISRRNGEYQYPFNGLPFAKPEVEMIARLFPTTRPLIDQAFSRNATIPFLNSYNIVHFATHAQFTTGAPDDSFIVLGDGETIDLNDIRNLSLTNVDLMVLSGCQTAVSTLDLGQGLGDGVEILGFGYQVQNAGVRAAIASLWSVDDGGTEVLMRQLYTRLQGNLSKAAALQQAQIALIRGEVDLQADAALPNLTELEVSQLAHPYYWAPFILIGNGL